MQNTCVILPFYLYLPCTQHKYSEIMKTSPINRITNKALVDLLERIEINIEKLEKIFIEEKGIDELSREA